MQAESYRPYSVWRADHLHAHIRGAMDATMHKQEVGSRLRLTIEALDLRQADVARAFDVSPSKLGNWLRGSDYPNEYFIYRFCERYGVSADWIYLGKVSGLPSSLADALWKAKPAFSAA